MALALFDAKKAREVKERLRREEEEVHVYLCFLLFKCSSQVVQCAHSDRKAVNLIQLLIAKLTNIF